MHIRIVTSLIAASLLSGCAAKQKTATPPLQATAPAQDVRPTQPHESEAALASDRRELPGGPLAIYFDFDSAELASEARAYLHEVGGQLRERPDVEINIEGHCDERGTSEYNMALGERRARVVTEFLARLGVEGARLRHVSYGEERPAAAGHDESAYAKNRRSELVLGHAHVTAGGVW